MMPFSTVESPAFRKLLRNVSGKKIQIVSRPTLMNRMEERYQKMVKDVSDILAKQTSVCATFDCWSSRKRSYIGSTVHFIDEKSLKRRSYALACARLEGSHTFDVLARYIRSILALFKIENNCSHIVTDNASNFLKAFRICTEEYLEIYNSLMNREVVEINSIDLQAILKFSDETFIVLPSHIRCVAHTLNLVCSTDFEEKLKAHEPIYNKYKTVIKICHALWSAQNQSTQKSDFISGQLGKLFKTPGATRWNSLFDSIQDLLEVIETKDTKFDYIMKYLKLQNFDADELTFLKLLSLLFDPVAQALDILQGDETIYCGITVPIIVKLNKKIEKIARNSDDASKICGNIILNSLKKR